MSKTKETQISQIVDKDIFTKIANILREELIAVFERETDTSLVIRLVGGDSFRLSIEKITH